MPINMAYMHVYVEGGVDTFNYSFHHVVTSGLPGLASEQMLDWSCVEAMGIGYSRSEPTSQGRLPFLFLPRACRLPP